jgi:hypothetical protein
MMERFDDGELQIEVQETPESVLLTWRGRSAARDPAARLRPFLELLLAHGASRGQAVRMHFAELEYFNSSTVAELVRFINEARTRGVALVMVYDGAKRWQELSFGALSRAMRPFCAGDIPVKILRVGEEGA